MKIRDENGVVHYAIGRTHIWDNALCGQPIMGIDGVLLKGVYETGEVVGCMLCLAEYIRQGFR